MYLIVGVSIFAALVIWFLKCLGVPLGSLGTSVCNIIKKKENHFLSNLFQVSISGVFDKYRQFLKAYICEI